MGVAMTQGGRLGVRTTLPNRGRGRQYVPDGRAGGFGVRHPHPLARTGGANGNMPLTALQAGSVFVTPLFQTGVADDSTSLTALQAGSVFGTPLARTGATTRKIS